MMKVRFNMIYGWCKKYVHPVFLTSLIACLVFLLGETLYVHIFKSLWEFLDLKNNTALHLTVALLCFEGFNCGACAGNKIIDRNHKILYVTAIVLYIYYKFFFKYSYDDYTMIPILRNIDGFALVGISFVSSYIFRKIINYVQKAIEDKDNYSDLVQMLPLYLDEPIRNTKEDLFQYTILARSLTSTILSKFFSHSYSIGITSSWGAGKSSFLNLLKNELARNNDILVVEFNARASANIDSIQADFLSLLASVLSPFHTGMKSVVKEYMADLNVLSADTPWEKLFGALHIKDATDSREKLQKGIVAIGKKIVIIIDDLDRLTGSEILEVLKLITKNAAFKNTIFVTAYDKEYVNGILESSLYKPKGQKFTDKYFNMEIDLPKSNDYLRSNCLLDELLKLKKAGWLTACTEYELRQIITKTSKYITKYLQTLRDVKRFLNTFCASYIPIQDEVYFFDYLLLSLLKFAKPNTYSLIKEQTILKDIDGVTPKNIYVIKEQSNLEDLEANLVSLLFPHQSSGNIEDLNIKGQKHIYWKRSFNKYFYNLEYTNLHQTDIKQLLMDDVRDKDIRALAEEWKQRKIEVDIKDFLLKIEDEQRNKSQLKAYLRLCMICYRYTLEKDIFFVAARYLYYYSWNEKKEKFKFQTKEEYKKYIEEILQSSSDINASSVFLHQILFYQLSENKIKAEDCVFTDKELKKISLWRLKEGLYYLKGKKITGSDVLYLTLSCVDDADPSDSGSYGFTIIPEAKKMLEQSIWENPNEYLFNVITHKKANGNCIQFYMNEDSPFSKIYTINELEEIIKGINVEDSDELLFVCNFWSEYLQYCFAQKSLSPVVSFKGDFKKLEEYDYRQYNLVMEGEVIE